MAHLLERYCGINYLGRDAWTVNHVQGYKVQKVGDLQLPAIEWAETPAFRYRQSVSYSERDPLFVDWYGMERPNQMFMDNLWVHTFDKILPSRSLWEGASGMVCPHQWQTPARISQPVVSDQ